MHPIHVDGLVLRPFEDRDAADFSAAVRASVQSVGPWMPWCHAAFSEQDALSWFQTCRGGLAAGSMHEFGIFSQADAQLLGGAGLNSINPQHQFCNLGYWVKQSAQRQGVALRTVRALAQHAFANLGLRRVEIVVACGNVASEGVAIKSGALFECVARNRLQIRGEAVAASVFSLIP